VQGPQCVIRHLWIEIRDSIASVVDDVTLADMVEREQKLREDQHDETAHQF
jgi:DNA-binding IscR family transcriptional regulator